MNNLPPELILYIFKFLPLEDHFRLRCTCKTWLELFDYLKPDKFIFYRKDRFCDHKLINNFNSIAIKDIDKFIEISSSIKFKKIKKLKVFFKNYSLLKPNKFYNQFTELEELCCDHSYFIRRIKFNLLKLKKFKSKNPITEYELDTPSLIELNIDKLSKIQLKYPERLKILKTIWFELDDVNILFKLNSLEKLSIEDDLDERINNELLERLNCLTELHILYDFAIDNTYKNLTYRRSNLTIYIEGFKIDNYYEIMNREEQEDINLNRKKIILNYLINNYNKIDKLRARYEIFYNHFINLVNNQIPIDFYDKVNKIITIIIEDQVDDELNLLEFIEKSKIKQLYIRKDAILSNWFYQQLIKKGQTIQFIELNVKNLQMDLLSNEFEFIFKMNLKRLSINEPISIDFLIKTIKLPNCINYIKFQSEKEINNLKSTDRISLDYYNLNDYKYRINLFVTVYIRTQTNTTKSFHKSINFQNESEFYDFLQQCKQQFTVDRVDGRDLIFLIEKFKFIRFVNCYFIKKLFYNHTFVFDKNLYGNYF